jgi:hypothetical protein
MANGRLRPLYFHAGTTVPSVAEAGWVTVSVGLDLCVLTDCELRTFEHVASSYTVYATPYYKVHSKRYFFRIIGKTLFLVLIKKW